MVISMLLTIVTLVFAAERCTTQDGSEGFRCDKTYCWKWEYACDLFNHCDDKWDEEENCERNDGDCGCHRYGSDCNSWHGRKYVLRDGVICTPNDYNEAPGTCGDGDFWYNNQSLVLKPDSTPFRCNNGLCIPKEKFHDGNEDCQDGSDEKESSMPD